MNVYSNLPQMIYGTAWKEERTSECVKSALACGFRAIDTANQKKHYREDFVGNALSELNLKKNLPSPLFLQTKYTYARGQDHRLPYNPEADYKTQVKSSLTSSLNHLHVQSVDSFLLHGPFSWDGLEDPDWEVWSTFEEVHRAGHAKMIGVSNFNIWQLKELCSSAKIKPMIVQNRCFANHGWDKLVREYCLENQIVYQGFSLLTANPQIANHPKVAKIATQYGKTPQQVVFRFSQQIGILPITGTTNKQHMQEDLNISDFELKELELQTIFSI